MIQEPELPRARATRSAQQSPRVECRNTNPEAVEQEREGDRTTLDELDRSVDELKTLLAEEVEATKDNVRQAIIAHIVKTTIESFAAGRRAAPPPG